MDRYETRNGKPVVVNDRGVAIVLVDDAQAEIDFEEANAAMIRQAARDERRRRRAECTSEDASSPTNPVTDRNGIPWVIPRTAPLRTESMDLVKFAQQFYRRKP